MDWIGGLVKMLFLSLQSSWQHFCRLVADSYLKKLCNTVRYTLENTLVPLPLLSSLRSLATGYNPKKSVYFVILYFWVRPPPSSQLKHAHYSFH